jgi:hypothetical protein
VLSLCAYATYTPTTTLSSKSVLSYVAVVNSGVDVHLISDSALVLYGCSFDTGVSGNNVCT